MFIPLRIHMLEKRVSYMEHCELQVIEEVKR
jgi:hypothetical protein